MPIMAIAPSMTSRMMELLLIGILLSRYRICVINKLNVVEVKRTPIFNL